MNEDGSFSQQRRENIFDFQLLFTCGKSMEKNAGAIEYISNSIHIDTHTHTQNIILS